MIHAATLKTLATSLCVVLVATIGAAGAWAIEAKALDPGKDTAHTRPPQHLRVFFDVEPDPAKSELTLTGPEGKLVLEGLHTMGEKDLMIRIVGRVADGEYTASFKATGTDGSTTQGEWKFAVKRAAS